MWYKIRGHFGSTIAQIFLWPSHPELHNTHTHSDPPTLSFSTTVALPDFYFIIGGEFLPKFHEMRYTDFTSNMFENQEEKIRRDQKIPQRTSNLTKGSYYRSFAAVQTPNHTVVLRRVEKKVRLLALHLSNALLTLGLNGSIVSWYF